MATAAPITGAPMRAPSNVIALPTAAKRKVRQNYNRASRAAKAVLAQHPAEFMFPGQRDAERHAAVLANIVPSPAAVIVSAIFEVLDEKSQLAVLGRVATGFALGWQGHEEAAALLRINRLNAVQRHDLNRALRRHWEGR